jgi:hypothetical protein
MSGIMHESRAAVGLCFTCEVKGTEATESWPAPLLLITTLLSVHSLLRSITQTVARFPRSQMFPCSTAYVSSRVAAEAWAAVVSLCRDATMKSPARSNAMPAVSRLAGGLGSNLKVARELTV